MNIEIPPRVLPKRGKHGIMKVVVSESQNSDDEMLSMDSINESARYEEMFDRIYMPMGKRDQRQIVCTSS